MLATKEYMKYWRHLLFSIVLIAALDARPGNAKCSSRDNTDCIRMESEARSRYQRFFEKFSKRRMSVSSMAGAIRVQRYYKKRSTAPSEVHYHRANSNRYQGPPLTLKLPPLVTAKPVAHAAVGRSRQAEEQQVALRHLRIRLMHARKQALIEKLQREKQKPWWGIWTTWSACGRTCGSGVQFQERHCLGSRHMSLQAEADCEGPTKRYRICNPNPCSPHMLSFRKLQCLQHAADEVRGEYYKWKPYGHPVDEVVSNEPCQLVCVSNVNEIQINTVAMDGTECHQGWNPGRCVEGKCKLIGCDGRINSDKLRNKCGKCDGDGTSCVAYEDIFSKLLPSEGDYEVVRIPRGAYDILVNERRETSASLVIKNSNDALLFNGGGIGDLSGKGEEGWPSNIMIAGVEFRYRKPVLQSSETSFEYLLSAGPIKESIVVYLRAKKAGLGLLHYEFKVPVAKVFTSPSPSSEISPALPTNQTMTEVYQASSNENKTTIRNAAHTNTSSSDIISATEEVKILNRTEVPLLKPILLKPPNEIVSEKPRIILLPEWEKKDVSDSPIKYDDSQYTENKEDFADIEEEDFIVQRETTLNGGSEAEHIDGNESKSTNDSQPTSEDKLLFIKPPLTILSQSQVVHEEEKVTFIRLDDSNNTDTIARVYTVERQIPHENETVDNDVAGGDDEIPEDGGEDYSIAPGVDIPIPVHGSRHDGRYASRASSAYEWHSKGYAPCSSTCTSGLQDSYVLCRRRSDRLTVDDSYCDPTTRPEPVRRSCVNRPCKPRWEVTPWSECSLSCGVGVQTRTVRCWKMIGPGFDSTLYTEKCDEIAGEKPEETKPCTVLDKCGPLWETSDWSNCPAPCGRIGVMWRNVRCSAGRDTFCAASPRPISEDECRGPPCLLTWVTADWGPCSGVCGGGRKTRRIICADRHGNAHPEDQCDPGMKPVASHPCGDVNCRPEWIAQDWGECSVDCGPGSVTRVVICAEIINGQVHKYEDDSPCDPRSKPATRNTCHMGECDPVWFTTSWSKCSVTCGSGHRVREVKCYQQSVPADGCDKTQMPSGREACVMPACPQPRPSEQCKDKSSVNCKLVIRVGLCTHWYYRKACCGSCNSN